MARVGATAMQAIQAKATGPDGTPEMPPLEVTYPHEVLLIASRCNTLIGVQRQTDHLALFPNARLEVIEDAGHLMFTDQPEASLDAVRSYLLGWPGTPSPEWLVGTWSLTGECQTDHLVEDFGQDGTWTDVELRHGTWQLVNRRLTTTTTLRRVLGADTSGRVVPPEARTVRLERVSIDRGRIRTVDGRQVSIARCSDR
ncbi:MAG: hypothetical protein KTR31_31470 [Myxococcales bacterium]|nr:hypothetical protein [Myxococcales bacterium]